MNPIALLMLVIFHIVFFRRFYLMNPFLLCTSELAHTHFPACVWQARNLFSRKDDIYYYPLHRDIPFLSFWYWPQMIFLQLIRLFSGDFKKERINLAFALFSFFLLAHYLWASVGAYLALERFGFWTALSGAVGWVYMAYAIKQNPCIIYTISWLPWVFFGLSRGEAIFTLFACGMSVLGGYWPLGMFLPVMALCFFSLF